MNEKYFLLKEKKPLMYQTYTLVMPCTNIGNKGPECPEGWESVGYTQIGSCIIGNVPGNGPMDVWKQYGYNRVCKKKIVSSGDMGVDCCSNLYGISNSIECKTAGYKPYSDQCNNIMVEKCNTNVQKNIYGNEWNGMPYGDNMTIYNNCNNSIRNVEKNLKYGCEDEYCRNYLRNAPTNNFFHNHDFQDYPYYFPEHSYTTPNFNGLWGYQPMRLPYKPYNDYKNKNNNNFCRKFPEQCCNYLS
jgi:hypothetical protein